MTPVRLGLGLAALAAVGYATARLLEHRTGRPVLELARDFASVAREASRERESELRDALGLMTGPADEDIRPGRHATGVESSAPSWDDGHSLTPQQARELLLDPAGRPRSGR